MDYLLESIGLKKSPAGPKGVIAEFADPAALMAAARKLRDKGFSKFDCHSPFPIHGMDDAMGLKPSKLGWIVFVCGLSGGSIGMLLEWWTSAVNYPLIISGKPFFSLPAFIPVCFELTILGAAFGAVLGMFALNQLPRFHHPVFYSSHFGKFSDDGFFVSVEATDPLFQKESTAQFLAGLGGTHIELLEDPDEG